MKSIFNPPLPLKSQEKLNWGQACGSALGLAIAEAALKSTVPLLVITPSSLISHQLYEEIAFFSGNSPDLPIYQFPDRETLPYDIFSPHEDIISERLFTLYQLPSLKRGVVIVSTDSVLSYLLPRGFLDTHSFVVKLGDKLETETLRNRLESAGYRHVGQVMEHGEYTIRGSIIDLFPMGSDEPLRVDRFGDEVDTIRTFDPDTQLSIAPVEEVKFLPAREYPLSKEAITYFRQNWHARFAGNPSLSPIYQSISAGQSAPGIEYYLPLFYEKLSTLFDYLPQNTVIVETGNLNESLETFWMEVKQRYEDRRHDITRPLLPPEDLFIASQDFFTRLQPYARIKIDSQSKSAYAFSCQEVPDVKINRKAKQPFNALQHYLQTTPSRTLFSAETAGRREALLDLLKSIQVIPVLYASWQECLTNNDAIGIVISPIISGFSLPDVQIDVITESQLFESYTPQAASRSTTRVLAPDAIIRDLIELNIGAPVVHVDHGIGRYLGLETITLDTYEAEFLTLEYAAGDKLYVPVSSLHLVSRYTGPEGEQISLHKLGHDQWTKAKRKAAERIRDIAAELLELYAKRAIKEEQAQPRVKSSENYFAFASAFPFETTQDQERAITEVLADMQSSKIMDRLVCGDVGFGKTEVAMRAAFLAVENNLQVAILVPTTLLAQQHYETFKDRFADWPVKVEVLSRFRSTKEQASLIQQLKEGKIDIVISTHRLLQKDIAFQNLGLLVVDEEHRFGVQQKERIKALREEVDLLTLTATPIPRTLNIALAGIRDLSIISTPPARRLAIKTFMHEYDKYLIREAILRELHRGGQVYYLHNTVETIDRATRTLQELIPEAKFVTAHGQMHDRDLERVMSDFYHHKFNVLVSTTIIESGLDIPTANTILIERADRFGLAQLHQLRGRVGRSHHQAYAYLLTPPETKLSAEANKRLEAITQIEDLGAGFMLATHDLEIRGAGEFLGHEQSGHMQQIGFSLYMEMLERAIASLKEGKEIDLEHPLQQGAEVDIKIPALIPETYLSDVHTRLIFYKRIASAKDAEQLQNLMIEMIDRFGLLAPPTKNLFRITEMKLRCEKVGIRKLEANLKQGIITFADQTSIHPEKLVMLLVQKPKQYKLISSNKLQFKFPEEMKTESVLDEIEAVFKDLSE